MFHLTSTRNSESEEATKSKFPDIVDEGESGMKINNILSDLGLICSVPPWN